MSQSDDRGLSNSPNDSSADEQIVSQQYHERFANLTGFRRDILFILAREGDLYGLAIKRKLQEYYGAEVNHGRLYPNLDTLVDEGLVAKSELDKRTNEYALTDDARELLDGRQAWERGDA